MASVMLTRNFSVYEMIRSERAARLGIDNNPPPWAVWNLRQLCTHVLQPARDVWGPITVSSGFRNKELNKAVGGSRRSAHMEGKAADIYLPQKKMSRLFNWISDHCPYDQLIWEYGGQWIHVSYDSDRDRRQVLATYQTKAWGFTRTRYRLIDPREILS